MSSIRSNFIYSAILTGANYIFPLIVFPYTSRVLGVTNIGICNFVDSIVQYFYIFSMLGINVVGVREIAKAKSDKDSLNRCFSSILAVNTLLTIIAIIVYIVCIYTIPKLYAHIDLMWVGAIKLCFNFLVIEWLFKGLEEFKFITTRTLIIKIIYVIAIMLFVKEANDYKLFYVLTMLHIVVNAIVNCIYARKYVSISLRHLTVNLFWAQIFILGLYAVLTNMYTTFNVAFLGFVSGETEVGYYSTAAKIFVITLSLFSALTGVLLPRMSYLISERRIAEYRSILKKTTDLLMSISIPGIIVIIVFAHEIVMIVSGEGYEGAVRPLQLMIPLLFIIGYEQILVIQGLMPLQKDKSILFNSIVGAIVGLTINCLLVPYYKSMGSSCVWLVSELSVLLVAQYFMNKYVGIQFPFKELLINIICISPLIFILIFIKTSGTHFVFNLFCGLVIASLYSFVTQFYIIKTPIVRDVTMEYLGAIKRKIKE